MGPYCYDDIVKVIKEANHDPNVCVICNAVRDVMPSGAPGVTESQAARALGEHGMWDGLLAGIARLLVTHGWRELPHPLTEREHGPRFAPPALLLK